VYKYHIRVSFFISFHLICYMPMFWGTWKWAHF